jgi:hypothetical protein
LGRLLARPRRAPSEVDGPRGRDGRDRRHPSR